MIAVFFTALALAADSAAVSICISLNYKKKLFYLAFKLGLWFGFFQSLMTLFGYYISNKLFNFLLIYGNYIAFLILFSIGLKMILDIKKEKICIIKNSKILFLAVATSIDALAIGVAYSFTSIDIYKASIIIGIVTFLLAMLFSLFSSFINSKFIKYFEFIGGFILIIIAFLKLF